MAYQPLGTKTTLGRKQGSKIALVRLYLRVRQAAGQVKILIFIVKIKFIPIYPNIFVMQGECLVSDISSPGKHNYVLGKGKQANVLR